MTTSVENDAIRVLAGPLRPQIVTLLARPAPWAKALVEQAGRLETEPYGRLACRRLRPDALGALADSAARLNAQARAASAAGITRARR